MLRVDSPGGSYVASDVVWREVARVRQAGIPVIVSMGDLAASGGYFVSMGADVIVAEPGTLTGSIGVFGGKLVQADLVERLRIAHDAVDGGICRDVSPYPATPGRSGTWSTGGWTGSMTTSPRRSRRVGG